MRGAMGAVDSGAWGLGWGGRIEKLSEDDKTTIKWIIDQLSCVQTARSILQSLKLLSPESWTDSFKGKIGRYRPIVQQ